MRPYCCRGVIHTSLRRSEIGTLLHQKPFVLEVVTAEPIPVNSSTLEWTYPVATKNNYYLHYFKTITEAMDEQHNIHYQRSSAAQPCPCRSQLS